VANDRPFSPAFECAEQLVLPAGRLHVILPGGRDDNRMGLPGVEVDGGDA
jgi:hypothetical protein